MALIVVKIGGELFEDAARAEVPAWAHDIRMLDERGRGVLLVHGGGAQASALQKRLGLEPKIIAGRRVTDEATLEVMKMAVAGAANLDLCCLLLRAGLRPLGLHGASGPVLMARKRAPSPLLGGPAEPVDLGLVGDVMGFDLGLLDSLVSSGYVPVIACLGCDERTGTMLNINADRVASALAAAARAQTLVLLTKTPGVLANPQDPASRIPSLDRAQALSAVEKGQITGGMLAKLEESFDALDQGVSQIQILGDLGPGDLVRAIESPGSVGTVLLQTAETG